MRLLYLHQPYSGPRGAISTRAHAMASALAAAGHEVTLACGGYAGADPGIGGPFRMGRRAGWSEGGFRVVQFATPGGNAAPLAERALGFAGFAAAAPLALRRWDGIIASSPPLPAVLPALAARLLRGTPFLFEIRDPWPELPRAMTHWLRQTGRGRGLPGPVLSAMGPLAAAACRHASAVAALSEGMAETALARGADPARVAVIPNGCDLGLFGPAVPPARPEAAAPGEVLAVYAGAHGLANGLDLLLEAARLLAARGERRLRLLLVGEGAEKPRLLARAAALGLPNLTFLDPMPKPALARLLAGSQIGLQCLAPVPEFGEWTSPNKARDYLAAGLPVVAAQGGAMARLLAGPPPAGIATPPGDPAALAEALAALAADPA
ncbi:MAG: glycosyltransferase, partial [Acetobacteraceae bacterium]|nr:glycosyltransferase [Acetobacteraceae bacterium]